MSKTCFICFTCFNSHLCLFIFPIQHCNLIACSLNCVKIWICWIQNSAIKTSLYTRQSWLNTYFGTVEIAWVLNQNSKWIFQKKFINSWFICLAFIWELLRAHFKVGEVSKELDYAYECISSLFKTLANYLTVCCRELIHSRNQCWIFETITHGIVI